MTLGVISYDSPSTDISCLRGFSSAVAELHVTFVYIRAVFCVSFFCYYTPAVQHSYVGSFLQFVFFLIPLSFHVYQACLQYAFSALTLLVGWQEGV